MSSVDSHTNEKVLQKTIIERRLTLDYWRSLDRLFSTPFVCKVIWEWVRVNEKKKQNIIATNVKNRYWEVSFVTYFSFSSSSSSHYKWQTKKIGATNHKSSVRAKRLKEKIYLGHKTHNIFSNINFIEGIEESNTE